MTQRQPDWLTRKYLNDALDYDPAIGRFQWKIRPRDHFRTEKGWRSFNTQFSSKGAFYTDDGQGYRQGRLNGCILAAHRVAWYFVHGEWPVLIDHINGCASDNRLVNLRNVTNAENCRNQKRRSTNSSGVTGVTWSKRGSAWQAQICQSGQAEFLGYFPTIEQAAAARKCADVKYGFHSNHGRSGGAFNGK